MAKPTLTLTGKQWTFPWLRGQLQQPLCLVSPWGHAEKYTQWEVSQTILPSFPASLGHLHHLEDFLPLGREPHREKPLTPTTKLLFKMEETRCNSHHRKCPKTFNFKRTIHFLCHLKLIAAAITPASNAHSTAPRKSIPTRRAVQSTAYLWQPSDTGVPLP